MKKTLAAFLSFALGCFLFCQAGINTGTPKATLEVSASADNLSKTDGIIPPRLTGDQPGFYYFYRNRIFLSI